MAAVTWAVEVDWDRSGTYETDITSAVTAVGSGVVIDRGMNADGVYEPARVAIVVDNSDGTYSYGNTASARYGQLRDQVPIRVRGTFLATPYTEFTGYIMGYRTTGVGAGGVSTCTFDCTDLAGLLGEIGPIDVSVAERLTSAAYTAIAAQVPGLTGADYNFPTGAQTLPVHWVAAKDALSAMAEVWQSELGGIWYVDALGVIQGEPRTTRQGTSVDDTWGDGTSVFPVAGEVVLRGADTITNVQVQAQILSQESATAVILTFSRNATNNVADSLALLANEVYEVTIPLPSPTESIVAPVATTDYTANSAQDGSGSDQTASLSVTATLLGGMITMELKNTSGSTIYVTRLEVRGLAQNIAPDRPIFRVADAISGNKGNKGISVFLPFADDSQATRDYAAHLLYANRAEAPRLRLVFRPGNDTARASMLGLELGDLVKYKDTGITTKGLYADDWYYVDRIRHVIPPNLAGQTWEVVVDLVPSYVFRRLDKLVFDTFNRSNATGDLGISDSRDTWANDTAMDITSNTARASSDTLQVPDLDCGTGANDMVVDAKFSNIGTGDEVGVTLRKTDANNFYNAYVDKGDNKVHLEKNVAGVVTALDGGGVAFTVGTSHEVRALIQSTRIRVWVDNRLYIDTTDSSLATGTKCGLWFRNANATTTCSRFYGEGV